MALGFGLRCVVVFVLCRYYGHRQMGDKIAATKWTGVATLDLCDNQLSDKACAAVVVRAMCDLWVLPSHSNLLFLSLYVSQKSCLPSVKQLPTFAFFN